MSAVRSSRMLSETAAESLSSGDNGDGDRKPVNERADLTEQIAGRETRAVWRSKFLVLIVLLALTIAVAIGTYRYVHTQEESDFVKLFTGFAGEVSQASANNAKNMFNSISAFSNIVTSLALDKNASWPNMTIPFFEIQGREVHELAGSLMLSFVPIVAVNMKAGWEAYSCAHQGWVQEGQQISQQIYGDKTVVMSSKNISNIIYRFARGGMTPVVDVGPYAPQWQLSPAPNDPSIVNLDLLNSPVIKATFDYMMQNQQATLSEVVNLRTLYQRFADQTNEDPHSFLLQPVYDHFGPEGKIVAFLMAVFPWNKYFANLVHSDVKDIFLVLESCGATYTYLIRGDNSLFLGEGDLHQTQFDTLEHSFSFYQSMDNKTEDGQPLCDYIMHIYPSQDLYNSNQTNKPFQYAAAVSCCFIITTLVFLVYDAMVNRRQNKVMSTALRTNKIVSSLFPSNVRDRIMREAEEHICDELNSKRHGTLSPAPKARLRTFLRGDKESDKADAAKLKQDENAFGSQPIADLFMETTIMFADIVGFTAWSSTREPEQVFTLLETLYHAFDQVATRLKVFKVETVGDCYVAVTGLPDPQKDHAIIMAKFAHECLLRMKEVSQELEISLGPDTADLGMRFGLHSGPVTAGVLRGERARFQLFGDTMNTASRMETTGVMNRIHISKDTAELLINSGKGAWVKPREEKVIAKGKGVLESFWLEMESSDSKSRSVRSSKDEDVHHRSATFKDDVDESMRSHTDRDPELSPILVPHLITSKKIKRLISWNVELLCSLLKQVVARRLAVQAVKRLSRDESEKKLLDLQFLDRSCPLDEVKEIVALPRFDPEVTKKELDPEEIELDEVVLKQLNEYVTSIAAMYHDNNPFHNFEHASHVTMSVKKLLARIVRPDAIDEVKDLHDYTYGITSDPLTQFAVVFSALVHDVDHAGVPNAVLVKEKSNVAAAYNNKSVLEQNSVDIAWRLLMKSNYKELLGCICATKPELCRFRQLVVNSVMATDIMDKDLGMLRKMRWDKAFSREDGVENAARHHLDPDVDAVNRKATIVIEHLMQASDVAHTMQHWHVYLKWNESFFHEMYRAYLNGHLDKDPSESWYESELGFFEFYIIPLAKKLNTCGVFGVSCYEYLGYAQKNRREWEVRGREMVQEYMKYYNQALPSSSLVDV